MTGNIQQRAAEFETWLDSDSQEPFARLARAFYPHDVADIEPDTLTQFWREVESLLLAGAEFRNPVRWFGRKGLVESALAIQRGDDVDAAMVLSRPVAVH